MPRSRSRGLFVAGCVIAGLLTITHTVDAQQGEWRLGGRLLYVSMGATTDPLLDTGSHVEFDSSWTAEFDATYMLGTTWGMEFMLTTAPHDLAAVDGALDGFDIGKVWMAESTITINYHIQLWGKWKPYVGAGLGMAYLHSSDLTAGTEAIGVSDIRSDLMAGIAGQVGVTHRYNRYWMFSFDIKYNAASGDIRFTDDDGSTTERVGTDVNSWLVGLGAAVRFH